MSFEIDVERRLGDTRIALRAPGDSAKSAGQSGGGGLTALFGPSGAGKTSVLNMVAGLLRPDRGRIAVAGQVLFDSASGIDLPPERRRAGYVFQDGRLFPHRRVRDNLLYGWRLAPPAERWIGIEQTVEFLGIDHLMHRWPRTLSGGEAQRVAIGRALLSGPRFLLMDEPLSSLDAARREEILRVIERVRDELGLPILYVSHDSGEVARLACAIIPLGG
ncbi:molybdenum ABC transporter ATP-binding protein [Sphingobium lignivorans]|uniref:Molybdate transport system ATP-binding protein n=1 Tax=Sphingobium lignivorans TaxID=2735886 RepID=A0ABR6NIY6_9SPHN|nr:ATP-binding cassette domain-containing protein [Sphingobium lignivorans]MBB5987241.1 molybdate transport system ATP-binding protein [Sphingobium lignivorans]